MIRQQISLANRLTHQSTILTNKWRQWPTRAEHRRLKSGPPLMRGLDVYKNIPVSVTKLMLDLRVVFISFHLIADKLFPVNPRAITGPPKMSLLLESKSMPALIIKPRFILVKHTDDIVGTLRPTRRESCSFKTSTGLSESQMLCQGSSRIAPQTVFQLTGCFKKTFLLTHKFGTTWAIKMTADREEWSEFPIGATTATHTKSGTSVIRKSSVVEKVTQKSPFYTFYSISYYYIVMSLAM